MNSSDLQDGNGNRGIPEQKFNVNRACFPEEKTPEFTKKGELHELLVLALSLCFMCLVALKRCDLKTVGVCDLVAFAC